MAPMRSPCSTMPEKSGTNYEHKGHTKTKETQVKSCFYFNSPGTYRYSLVFIPFSNNTQPSSNLKETKNI